MKGALSAGNHMQDGFTAAELVHGLTKMASHDHNSDVIMKKGVMLSLKKMLTTGKCLFVLCCLVIFSCTSV